MRASVPHACSRPRYSMCRCIQLINEQLGSAWMRQVQGCRRVCYCLVVLALGKADEVRHANVIMSRADAAGWMLPCSAAPAAPPTAAAAVGDVWAK
jgi:hypothetical protein